MLIEDISRIKEIAKNITVNTVLRKVEYKDPRLPTETRLFYRIELPEVMALLANVMGSGNLVYTNTPARVIDIFSDFVRNTNETGSFEWLMQSTSEWIAQSFTDSSSYDKWIEHLSWSYRSINPINRPNFDENLIGLDSDVCDRLIDNEIGSLFIENAFLVFLFTLQLSFNEIMNMLPTPPTDKEDNND